jgi:glycosyltransferase involved in cell wall biosynthesis
MPTVDVIIPAYNAATYLPAALESVISQTFNDWQIILVDDGSTDNTAEVVAPFLNRCGSKLTYIRQENYGLPVARNAAIRSSNSEFLALLDADDVWLPCRLAESLKAMMVRPEVGLCYGLITYIDQDGITEETFEGNRKHAEGKIAPHIYLRDVELPCPTMTFRRQCIKEVGLFDETMRATEDRDLWLRIALRYEVAFVPMVLAYYRRSSSSMSADGQRMLHAQLKFISKHFGAEGCGLQQRQAALSRSYKQYAENLKARGHAAAALRTSFHALVLYPLSISSYRTAASLLLNWIACLARSSDSQ